jgi:membrane associated rhomboid family serine protease
MSAERAPTPEELRVLVQQEQVRRRMLGALRPRPPATLALVVGISLIHLATGFYDVARGRTDLYGAFLGERSTSTLSEWGARLPDLLELGEPWRLVSCIFLHANLLHLAMNMVALFGLGRLAEAIFGPLRFLWLFLLCGLTGSLLSSALSNATSVGASGAIYGIMGACIVFGLRFRSRLPPQARSIFGRGLVPWVLLNVLISFSIPRIDVLGHFGGLFGGAILALLLGSPVIPGKEGGRVSGLAMAFASALLVGWAFGGVGVGLLWG